MDSTVVHIPVITQPIRWAGRSPTGRRFAPSLLTNHGIARHLSTVHALDVAIGKQVAGIERVSKGLDSCCTVVVQGIHYCPASFSTQNLP